jgi:PBSX family phage portal protein
MPPRSRKTAPRAAPEKVTLTKAVEEANGKRFPRVKSYFVSAEGVATSNALVDPSVDRLFSSRGALEPPYNPEMLALLFEHSNALRQNVDAYATNIDGFGHRFEPVIDLDTDEARDRIRNAIMLDRFRARETEILGLAPGTVEAYLKEAQPLTPSDAEVEQRIASVREAMLIEKFRLEAFYEGCSVESSFVSLRRRTRQDVEVTGNGYWEIIRNGAGQVCEFSYLPAYTMRLLPMPASVEVTTRVRVSELTIDTVKRPRRFRSFVQVVDQRAVFYKELGDPRVMSSRTGHFYKDLAALSRDEKGVKPATEILHFRIPSPRTPYGVPRWIGNLLAVLGSRQAEEVNFLYFENKSIPPLAILVSGGRVTKSTIERVESYIEANIKGKGNFHKILFLEAESSSRGSDPLNAGKMRIELKPLTEALQKDALFGNYDEANREKIGQSFRLPRIIRGDVRDFNRATAEAALGFAESQVFQPEREEFDWTLDHRINLPELGIRFWGFQSNDPVTRNPIDTASMVKDLSAAGVLTVEEARAIAADIFNRDFAKIHAWWAKVPMPFATAGMTADATAPAAPTAGASTGDPTAAGSTAEDTITQAQQVATELRAALSRKKRITMRDLENAHRLLKSLADDLGGRQALAKEAKKLVGVRDAMVRIDRDTATREAREARSADRSAEPEEVDVEDDDEAETEPEVERGKGSRARA